MKVKDPYTFRLVRDDVEYLVFRINQRIYFIHPENAKTASYRIAKAKAAGFGAQSSLLYIAEYVMDLKQNTMVKNRYPDQEWPKQIFEEIFSGVGNELDIR